MALPTGTVTFLFTDIEGSTRLIQQLGDVRSKQVFADYRLLLLNAAQAATGHLWEDQGESFLFVFQRAKDAVTAAVRGQRALTAHSWPEGSTLGVRMGLHTGEPVSTGDGYVGVDVHRVARICHAGHGGQVLLSETTRGLVADDLPDGVDLRDMGEHRLKDLARPHWLFQVLIPDLPSDFPPLKSLDVLPNNLPIQLTSFIGREREIDEVKRLLSTTRLLTLTGVGGVGKTRLAVQMAAQVVDECKDGVWLVELAPLSHSTLVPQTIASALGVREQPSRSIVATLIDFLRPKQLLLALDNAEHLIEACAQLADTLLRACPEVRILTTSREGLAIAGETIWRVPTLSLPDVQQLPPVEHLMEFEAIRLFVERAKAVLPGFKLTDENALAVARICHHLDGLPLAIELAAARVKVLSVEQIAARMDDRFRLLIGGGRTTLPRQQTLRAVIDWSHDLLSTRERTLLRRLSIFAGGWTLEAAEAVCSGNRDEIGDILDLLTQLVDKSLVVVKTSGGGARYLLLETVRQYGSDRLVEAGEATVVRTRHRDWYLCLAERAEAEHIGRKESVHEFQERAWLERLEVEHDNLRAALAWSKADEAGAEAELRLAGALSEFWFSSGHWDEGRGWLEDSLARNSQAPASALIKVLDGATHLAWRQGDNERAVSLGERGLALSREVGDETRSAEFLNQLSIAALRQGDYDRADTLGEEATERARRAGDNFLTGVFLGNRGVSAVIAGDYSGAAALFEESLMLTKEYADKEVGRLRITFALRGHGLIALRLRDYERATLLYREGLAICKVARRGKQWIVEECLEGLAAAASGRGDYVRGARLFAVADALRAALGDTVFATAWAEGRAMTLEQAIEYALSDET